MALTPNDLSALSTLIASKLEGYARGIVEDEVRRIPHEVRKHLQGLMRTEIKGLVRDVVAAKLSIEVKVDG